MPPSTIGAINTLPENEKRKLYASIIPRALLERFHLPAVESQEIQDFLRFDFESGTSDVEMSLFHDPNFPDPIFYGHLTDTLNGQIHILLYILNDPIAPRFDVDRTPDGLATNFGIFAHNGKAAADALAAGLAPGQVRRGLRLLPAAIDTFEKFIRDLGHDYFFTEPLFYHNAVLFERHGFAYQEGRRFMERIHTGFSERGDLSKSLDGSNPFRQPNAASSVRLRSWALHDGILGEPFNNVTMYKRVGKAAGVNTCPEIKW